MVSIIGQIILLQIIPTGVMAVCNFISINLNTPLFKLLLHIHVVNIHFPVFLEPNDAGGYEDCTSMRNDDGRFFYTSFM